MAMAKSTGKCAICGKSCSKSGISRHLNSCLEKERAAASSAPSRGGLKMHGFHLAIEGRDYPDYWLHLEMTSDAPLRVLDQFLRDTWLECCGHLSAFFIEGREYSPGSRVNAGRILSQGMQFYHRYDFGTMTDLTLQVLSQGDPSESLSQKSGGRLGCRLWASLMGVPIRCRFEIWTESGYGCCRRLWTSCCRWTTQRDLSPSSLTGWTGRVGRSLAWK